MRSPVPAISWIRLLFIYAIMLFIGFQLSTLYTGG